MIKKGSIICLVAMVFLSQPSAQVPVEMSKPSLEIRNERLVISYDILKSDPADRFRVWIEITDSENNPIEARTLTGHIGTDISGGRNKEIIWDYNADGISIDDEISVVVLAERLTRPVQEEAVEPPIEPPVKQVSTGVAVLQSAAFPGWGLSRIHKGKPHWIKGVAAYGCLAGSIILNQKAHTSYDQYLESFDVDESDALYNDAVQQDKLSKVLAYAAIGIWVADLVWVVIDASGKDYPRQAQSKPYQIRPDYNPKMNAPMLAFTYHF